MCDKNAGCCILFRPTVHAVPSSSSHRTGSAAAAAAPPPRGGPDGSLVRSRRIPVVPKHARMLPPYYEIRYCRLIISDDTLNHRRTILVLRVHLNIISIRRFVFSSETSSSVMMTDKRKTKFWPPLTDYYTGIMCYARNVIVIVVLNDGGGRPNTVVVAVRRRR